MDSDKKLYPVQVHIENFQSIDSLDVTVHGFTCITGPTNTGKSAILRAISKSLLNDPVVGLVRKGRKFVTVDVSSEGWGYKWEKGDGGVNRYTINGKVYDKTGQSQLPEIANFGFGSVKMGTDEVNPWYASQMDPLFLLNRPGSQVTDFISEVSRLNVIQSAIIVSIKEKKICVDGGRAVSKEIAGIEQTLESFSGLDNLKKLYEQISAQSDSINYYEQTINGMNRFNSKISSIKSTIEKVEPIAQIKPPKDPGVEEGVRRMSQMSRHLSKLSGLAKNIIPLRKVNMVCAPDDPGCDEFIRGKNCYTKIEKTTKSVSTLSNVGKISIPVDLTDDHNSLVKMKKVFDKLNKEAKVIVGLKAVSSASVGDLKKPDNLDRLKGLNNTLKNSKSQIDSLTSEYKDLDKSLKVIEKEMKKIPVCPSCDRPMKGNHEGHTGD
jgi:hypothetical protein